MRTRSNTPTCDDASLDCSEPVQLFGFSAILREQNVPDNSEIRAPSGTGGGLVT